MKNFFAAIVFSVIVLFFLSPCLTQSATPLEVDYIPVPGSAPPTTTDVQFHEYALYVFYFVIGISGLIALGAIIKAGFWYLSSAGRPEQRNDAKNQITAVILGLIILFCAWLIFHTINPQLLDFQKLPVGPILPQLRPGVLLCTKSVDARGFDTARQAALNLPPDQQEAARVGLNNRLKEVNENCWLAVASGGIPGELTDKIVEVSVVPYGTQKYGAILYEEDNYGGKNQIVYKPEEALDTLVGTFNVSIKPSSIRVFVLSDSDPNSDWYVQLFEIQDYNRNGAEMTAKEKKYVTDLKDSNCIDLTADFPIGATTLGGTQGATGDVFPPHQFLSVKIEGPFLVVFFRETCSGDWGPETELYVMAKSDSNLNDNAPFKDWCGTASKPYPCAKSMKILSAGLISL